MDESNKSRGWLAGEGEKNMRLQGVIHLFCLDHGIEASRRGKERGGFAFA